MTTDPLLPTELAKRASVTDLVLGQMLDRVRTGQWRPGTVLPGQRELVSEFGASGVPVREALSMLKTLGILNIRHGHKTEVRRMDPEVLQQLLPLAFHLEGEQSFRQIAELRLGIEPQAASMVAQRRTQADVDALADLTSKMRARYETEIPAFFEADFAFHVRIAEATGNPFFVLLLRTFSAYISHVQTWGCSQSAERRLRAVFSHESIVDAIAGHDPQRAFAEMESHLRYSATHYAPDHDATSPGAPATNGDEP